MARSKKTSKPAIKAAERRQEALKLRKQGLTYKDIGVKLGCSAPRAYKMVSDELKIIRAKTNETGEEIKNIELQRLDRLLELALEQAEEGKLQAIDRCVRIMERRAKLLGLDSAEKVEIDANIRGELTAAREQVASRINGIVARLREKELSEQSNGSGSPESKV